MAFNKSFDHFFYFGRLETSTSGAESSKQTLREESLWHNIIYKIIPVLKSISTKTLMHSIKHMYFMSLCKQTCSDDIRHLHECPKFVQTGSLCTWLKRYKVFGIVWSWSAWLKWNYFNAMMVMIMMMMITLIKSPVKHCKTDLWNYWHCPAQRQYKLQLS